MGDRYDRMANYIPTKPEHRREETIECCVCIRHVHPILITGKDVYKHRPDLHSKLFWQCPHCFNYVGCHPNTDVPLGFIASRELKIARQSLHQFLDPLWKNSTCNRGQVYAYVGRRLGRQFHIAELRSIEEVIKVREILKNFKVQQTSIEGDFE